jgi:lipopolysaccharide biosynthesis glycosyltransferase
VEHHGKGNDRWIDLRVFNRGGDGLALAEVTKHVAVACAANAAYAVPLAVMLRSAAKNLGDGYRLTAFVINDGLSEANRELISESLPPNAGVSWMEPPRKSLDRVPLWGRMPITTYYKMCIAEVLPEAIDRVVWLDCDMLVLDDITSLSQTPSLHTIAVQDSIVPTIGSRYGVAAAHELGLDETLPYFNAGMMVIDTESWRNDRIFNRALDYLRRFGKRVYFWDQEALNAVLAGKWKAASREWNWSPLTRYTDPNGRSDGEEAIPSIIHFSGSVKPWTICNRATFTELWLSYLDETPWKHWRPPRTVKGRLLSWYSDSRLRHVTYPAERWGMQITRRMTQHYA